MRLDYLVLMTYRERGQQSFVGLGGKNSVPTAVFNRIVVVVLSSGFPRSSHLGQKVGKS